MSVKKIAVIFDNVLRPDTTGNYCLRAMKPLAQVDHYLPSQMEQIPTTGFDLYLRIDDSLSDPLPQQLRPMAFWAIDTHLSFQRTCKIATGCDFVFAAQRPGAERLQKLGIPADWLPLACDPEVHRPFDVPQKHDFCFVGTMIPGARTDLIAVLQARFPESFVGQRFFEDMARIYSASRIVFNRSIRDDINMRVFEALGCGALLVTNDLAESGQEALFQGHTHLATYRDADELLEVVEFYRRHEEKRRTVAGAGRAEVLAKHTYRHRMESILAQVQSQSKTVIQSGAVPHEPFRFHHEVEMESAQVELLAQIPKEARRVLHLGCGAGSLGTALKARQAVYCAGIEVDSVLAQHAKAALDLVLVGDIEALDPDFPDGYFDAIVCGDGLARAQAPLQLLRRLREWLSHRGRLLVRIPNARHHSFLADLLEGNCTYQVSGPLQHANHRLLTRREVEKTLSRARFQIEAVTVVSDPGYETWTKAGWPRDIQIGPARIDDIPPGDVEDLHVRAFVIVATAMPSRRRHGLDANATELPSKELIRERLESARARREWPESQPVIDPKWEPTSAVDPEIQQLLDSEVSDQTRLVVEIGSWLGNVSAAIAGRASNAEVVAVDTWRGSYAQLADPRFKDVLPIAFDLFCSRCWNQRERTFPVDASVVDGLQDIFNLGLCPDFAFIHADHRFDAVEDGLAAVQALFPNCAIGGTGYSDPRIRQIVQGFARRHERFVHLFGPNRSAWKLLDTRHSEVPLSGSGKYPLTSIVIPTCDGWTVTRDCLVSLADRTDDPIEVIVVDNGSTDGTPAFLADWPGIRLFRNSENLGFIKAVNQGIRAATGQQILLLNNDTVVTTGWLRRLLDGLYASPKIGLVGPSTNNISGTQCIPINYRNLDGLDGFAWEFGKANDRILECTDRLVGFCMLVRKEVFDSIGVLDEQFGQGQFDDDDFCLRAIKAGYQPSVVRGAFVHHVGSHTFDEKRVDVRRLFNENYQKFIAKWPERAPKPNVATPAPLPALPPMRARLAPRGGLLLAHKEEMICLTMIVRDNQRTIDPALSSIYPFVDRINVTDTGSLDRTPEIVQRYAVNLSHFVWCKDFSAARNASLKDARCPWIFWMDSDDTLPQVMGPAMRSVVAGITNPKLYGLMMQIRCLQDDGSGEVDVSGADQVHIFRNRPDYRWDRRIHEQILLPIKCAGGEVAGTDLFIVHSGSDRSPEGRRLKYARDLELLHEELKDRPEDTFTMFNFGMTYNDGREYQKAEEYFRRCLAVSRPSETHVAKTYSLLIDCLGQLNRHDEAWETCQLALHTYPAERELLFQAGGLHRRSGRLKSALQAYQASIEARSDRLIISFNSQIGDHKAHLNIALIHEEMGNLPLARDSWKRVIEQAPTYRAGWRGWINVHLSLRQLAVVEASVRRLVEDPLFDRAGLRCEGAMGQARLHQHRGDYEGMTSILENALQRHPKDIDLMRQFAHAFLGVNDMKRAIHGFERLLELAPLDDEAHSHLGIAAYKARDFDRARDRFQAVTQIRPGIAAGFLWCGHVNKELGRIDESRTAYEEAHRLEPFDLQVIRALDEMRAAR